MLDKNQESPRIVSFMSLPMRIIIKDTRFDRLNYVIISAVISFIVNLQYRESW
jgi:hypothetical protein